MAVLPGALPEEIDFSFAINGSSEVGSCKKTTIAGLSGLAVGEGLRSLDTSGDEPVFTRDLGHKASHTLDEGADLGNLRRGSSDHTGLSHYHQEAVEWEWA